MQVTVGDGAGPAGDPLGACRAHLRTVPLRQRGSLGYSSPNLPTPWLRVTVVWGEGRGIKHTPAAQRKPSDREVAGVVLW